MLNSGCFIKNYESVKIFNEGVNLTSKKQWRVTCLKVGSTKYIYFESKTFAFQEERSQTQKITN